MNFKDEDILCTKCNEDKYTVLYKDGSLKTWSLLNGKQLYNNKVKLEWITEYYEVMKYENGKLLMKRNT